MCPSAIFHLSAFPCLWSFLGPGISLFSPANTIPFDIAPGFVLGVDMTAGSWGPVFLWCNTFLFLDSSTPLTFHALDFCRF